MNKGCSCRPSIASTTVSAILEKSPYNQAGLTVQKALHPPSHEYAVIRDKK